jgi:cell filamentation protein
VVYDAIPDPYCYRGSDVLKNVPGIRDAHALQQFEAAAVLERSREPIPGGKLSVTHYCAIHRHLFQDVYRWAGRYRTVRIAKDRSVFCYPENISDQMKAPFQALATDGFLADLGAERFSTGAAHFLTDLNAIHPFREGNGRAQNTFLGLLAARAGHGLDFGAVEPTVFLEAMIDSFNGDETGLSEAILAMVE